MIENVLNINPEIVYGIIQSAKEFQAKEGVEIPEKIPNSEYDYDWASILADYEDDLTYAEIKNTIEDLEPDQKIDLLSLMYIGRGDFEADSWSEARKEATQNIAPNLTGYLLSKPQIADYLEKGLEILGYSAE